MFLFYFSFYFLFCFSFLNFIANKKINKSVEVNNATFINLESARILQILQLSYCEHWDRTV